MELSSSFGMRFRHSAIPSPLAIPASASTAEPLSQTPPHRNSVKLRSSKPFPSARKSATLEIQRSSDLPSALARLGETLTVKDLNAALYHFKNSNKFNHISQLFKWMQENNKLDVSSYSHYMRFMANNLDAAEMLQLYHSIQVLIPRPGWAGYLSFYLLSCSSHFLFISSFIYTSYPQSMISAKMSTAARAATLRSHAAVVKAGSRSISYSALPAQTLKNSVQGQRSALLSTRSPVSQLVSPFAALPLIRSFHVATPLFQQQQQQQQQKEQQKEEKKQGEESKSDQDGEDSEKKEKKDDTPPPPPHGDKSPWQVFRETLQTEFKASKEWNESTKALASSAHQFSENENIKRARAAYEAASGAAGTRTSAALKSTGQVIGKSAAWTWNTTAVKGIRKGVNATGEGLEKATRPVRETEAYKSVKDAIDDGSSSRYGGWIEKEERRRQRQLREEQELKSGKRTTEVPVEDPEAGTNITLHKDSAWKESWRNFKDSNPMMQKMFAFRDVYEESENPLISTARSITDRIGGFFAENETAQVIKRFREIDPNFKMEDFQRELREYMLPEVLDAYVKGDVETLKLWLSDAQFSVYAALAKQYTTAGLRSDGRILDVRGVDISHARLLDPGEIPVFVVTCRAQEIHVYRNVKTGKLAAGMEDKVQLVTYAIGMTRIPEEVNNPETRGWRLIELQKAARDYI